MPFPVLVVFIVLGLLFAICFPFAVIWSLNTLFGLSLAWSLKNWLAVLILALFFRGFEASNKK